MSNALVFLHGFLGTPYDFGSISQLLKDKFNCVLIDLNASSSFDIVSQAQSVKKTLDNLEIKKAHFWGYSMGGRILLEFYKQFPDVCATLTFESTGVGIADIQERLVRLQRDQNWAVKLLNDKENFLNEWYSQDLFSSLKSYEGFENLISLRQKDLSQKHIQMLLEASPGNSPEYSGVLKQLDIPALALVGQNDHKYRKTWEKVIETNPKINVKVIENSGHVVHLENPQKAVQEFLNFHSNSKK